MFTEILRGAETLGRLPLEPTARQLGASLT